MTTRGPTRLQLVAALFRSRPYQPIADVELIAVGGRDAWRTRVSECRTKLHMHIPRPEIRIHEWGKQSWYRYLPPADLAVPSLPVEAA